MTLTFIPPVTPHLYLFIFISWNINKCIQHKLKFDDLIFSVLICNSYSKILLEVFLIVVYNLVYHRIRLFNNKLKLTFQLWLRDNCSIYLLYLYLIFIMNKKQFYIVRSVIIFNYPKEKIPKKPKKCDNKSNIIE